jgi:hypothetical protein
MILVKEIILCAMQGIFANGIANKTANEIANEL